jgi:hypothetical protein
MSVSSAKRARWAPGRTGMSFVNIIYKVGERQEP